MSEFIGTKLTMNLGERSYDIILKSGALENLYQFARLDRRVAVVTDSGVPAQYAQRVADQCKDAKIITVPQGEGSKSFKILQSTNRQPDPRTVPCAAADTTRRQPAQPPPPDGSWSA